MTDELRPALIPYARFLECRERRIRIGAELKRPEGERTIDVEALPVAVGADDRKRDAVRVPEPDPATGLQD